MFFIVFFTTFPLRLPRLVVGRWCFAAVAGATKIGISLLAVGISLRTNRDFPEATSEKSRTFALGDEDKGNAEVRPPT